MNSAGGVRRPSAVRRGRDRASRSRERVTVRTREGRPDWAEKYASRLFYSDLLVIVATIVAYFFIAVEDVRLDIAWGDERTAPYWLLLSIFALTWLIGLAVFDTRDRHVVGNGVVEYRRLVNATLAVFALLVAAAFFMRMDFPRSFFAVALPTGMALLVFSRWLWRQWLRRRQIKRTYVYRTIVAGEPYKAQHVISSIQRTEGTGLDIVGVVTSRGASGAIEGVPVLGDYDAIEQLMDSADIDTLVIAGADALEPTTMRRIGWAIADQDKSLVVAPALTDVAGPRIHTRPLAGLPLVNVEFPTLEGQKRFVKRSFDIVGSLLLIVVASPVLLATAMAVRLESPGPVLYRQTRIGRRGERFGMLKFRSMIADADDQLASLLDLQGTRDRPLHKVIDDPRITRVGRVIRKYSIDELPQLFNVLLGTMSLVGPRPQREAEVALYDEAAQRRLLVKPGMSGLWQVSGRSALSWDDAIRLDLYYVENWSFTQDIQILFRTVRAVVAPGASAH